MAIIFQPYVFPICVLFCLLVSACAPQISAQNGATLPKVSIANSEVRTIKSNNTGRTYDVYIRLPDAYDSQKKGKYPVLYVLDGHWDFKLLDSIYGGLYYDKFIPEIIIVGITYAGDKPDYEALRAKDYTPVPEYSIPGSGAAPQFLTFIKEELIPLIETNYQADASRRMLMGSSFGGLFTLYTLFTEPELFSDYIAASPAVTFGNRAAFKQEAEFAKHQQDLPVNLYVAVGELEPLASPVKAFTEVVKQRGYQGLNMEVQVVSGERHASNKPEAYNRGLKFIFQKK
jgi:hypothetical protein